MASTFAKLKFFLTLLVYLIGKTISLISHLNALSNSIGVCNIGMI